MDKELQEPETALKVVDKIGEAILNLEELHLRNALVADYNYIAFYIVMEETKQ